jgi:hypothetical protein
MIEMTRGAITGPGTIIVERVIRISNAAHAVTRVAPQFCATVKRVIEHNDPNVPANESYRLPYFEIHDLVLPFGSALAGIAAHGLTAHALRTC